LEKTIVGVVVVTPGTASVEKAAARRAAERAHAARAVEAVQALGRERSVETESRGSPNHATDRLVSASRGTPKFEKARR
jgi:hypothetical protein